MNHQRRPFRDLALDGVSVRPENGGIIATARSTTIGPGIWFFTNLGQAQGRPVVKAENRPFCEAGFSRSQPDYRWVQTDRPWVISGRRCV